MDMDTDSASGVCLAPATDDGPASTRRAALLLGIQALRRKLPQESEELTLLNAKMTSQKANMQGGTDEVAQHHMHAHVQHAHSRA